MHTTNTLLSHTHTHHILITHTSHTEYSHRHPEIIYISMYHIPRAPNTYHTANPNAQNIHPAYPPVMYPPPYFTFSTRPAEDMVAMRFQKRKQSPWGEMGSVSGLTTLSILECTREQEILISGGNFRAGRGWGSKGGGFLIGVHLHSCFLKQELKILGVKSTSH